MPPVCDLVASSLHLVPATCKTSSMKQVSAPAAPFISLVPKPIERRISMINELKNVEDILFDMFKNEDDKMSVNEFLVALKEAGLRKTDPRLRKTLQEFQALQKNFRRRVSSVFSADSARSLIGGRGKFNVNADISQTLFIDRDTFKRCIADGLVLISKALKGQLIVPDWHGFRIHIEEIYLKCKQNTKGKVADYIPQLSRFSPECWGVSVCTVDGQRASWGETCIPFSIQSASKTLNYGIVLNDLGADLVHQHVGQEPSGRIFNEICLNHSNLPHNPMINAGAIVVCNLIKSDWSMADRFEYTLGMYRKLAGGEHVEFSNSTFLSERETADRNYALAYFMREHKALPREKAVQDILEFYFQLCSAEVTCESASVIAATLANGGICPMTGEKVLSNLSVRDVLSLMYSCGMYDYSGQFAFHVGLPAKSGVSGVLLVVVPNVMGFALWSPCLDKLGNSVRGVQFCKELVERFNFHNYDSLLHAGMKVDPRRKDIEVEEQKVIHMLFSAADGDIDSFKRYILEGVDVNRPDYDGRTALHLAASEGHEDIIEFLLTRGKVDICPRDRWGHTPLDNCYYFHYYDCAKLIEKHLYPDGVPPEIEEHNKKMEAKNSLGSQQDLLEISSDEGVFENDMTPTDDKPQKIIVNGDVHNITLKLNSPRNVNFEE